MGASFSIAGRALAATLAGTFALAAAPASAAVIFNSLTISAATQATVGGAGGGTDADSNTVVYNIMPTNAFNVQSSAKNTANGQANAQTSVAVAFADSGHAVFDATSSTSITNLRSGVSGSAKAGKYDFIYNFTLTTNGTLAAGWDVSAPNVTQPAFGPTVSVFPVGSVILPPTQVAGLVPLSLSAGAYSLRFTADFQDLLSRTGPGTVRGSSSDHFDFAISSVPEPATWAFMLIGFGAVATQARRRRAATSVLA
jgi:PEP-CTERM motif